MSQALIQQARTYLHEHGYAFWYDDNETRCFAGFVLKPLGLDAGYQQRIFTTKSNIKWAYSMALESIGVPPEHRKPLTPNQNL